MKTHDGYDILLATKALINHEGKYLFVRRSETHPTHPHGWDLPGGLIDPGESPAIGVEHRQGP